MRKLTPLVSAYEARTILLEKKADISSTLKDSWGNVHLYFLRRDDGRLYRTLLNGVWIKAFENAKLLPFVNEDQKELAEIARKHKNDAFRITTEADDQDEEKEKTK